MSLIIAATDYSPIAENAVNYACNLATATKSRLLVLHTFLFPVMYSDVPFPASLIDDTQADAEEKMDAFIASLRLHYPTLIIESKVAYGGILEVTEDYCGKSTQPLLLIIGNNSGEENSTWFESKLNELSTNTQYPLLAVPPNHVYKPVLKLCYAFDNDIKGQKNAVRQLKKISDVLSSELHVLFANKDGLNRDNLAELTPNAKELLADAEPHYHYEYGLDVDHAIIDFAHKENIDWLAIMPRHYSFFKGLFHSSHTKAIAREINMPILLLQEEDSN